MPFAANRQTSSPLCCTSAEYRIVASNGSDMISGQPLRNGTAILAVLSLLLVASSLDAADSCLLQGNATEGHLQEVRVGFKVEGNLKIRGPGKQTVDVPLKVSAQLDYDERFLSVSAATGQPLRSLRAYRQAEADLQVASAEPQKLRDSRRLIRTDRQKTRVQLSSLNGPLTREELELLDTQANSMVLSALLPAKKVAIEETWEPSPGALALLLGLDTAGTSNVSAKLVEIKDNTAKVEFSGTITGTANGQTTEIDLAARLGFDIARRQVGWITLSLRENREVGLVSPGLAVTARIQVQVLPLEVSPMLTKDIVAKASGETRPEHLLLEFGSPVGEYHLVHDRRWHVTVDQKEFTKIRMVEEGKAIAQCNISWPADLQKGEVFNKAKFQEQVVQALGKNFGQVIDSEESATEDGLELIRVSVAGAVQEVPVIWTYYHLTNPQGRRLSFVFTCAESDNGVFSGADASMVAGVQFIPRREPTPAQGSPEGKVEEKAEKPAAERR